MTQTVLPAPGAELVTGIGELMTCDVEAGSPTLTDAALVVEGGIIVWVGAASQAPAVDRVTDVGGRAVLPGWVDSHTHLVFAGDRSAEFAARMAGQPYAAGGIAVTVAATRKVTDDELRRMVANRVADALTGGTTYLETKTGYGLDVEQEARTARIAAEFADEVTFLGAHVVPAGLSEADDAPGDPAGYLALVNGPMLDAVRPYAGWVDAFCDKGAFSVEQAREVLQAGAAVGLGIRVHGNQLGRTGGVRLAVELGAASVDHCNHLSDDDVDALAGSQTVATVLPACDLSTRALLAPARRLRDAGVTLAIASNCNPGTSYTTSMNFCVGTAVLQQGLSIEEAVTAGTWGGARALRRDTGTADRPPIGSIRLGARADLHVLDAPAAIHLAYRPGMPLTWGVWRQGIRMR